MLSQVESLRKDIEILSQNHERDVDRKDAIIQMLDRDLEEVGGFARPLLDRRTPVSGNILRVPRVSRSDFCVRSPRLTLVHSMPGGNVNTPVKERCSNTARPPYPPLATLRRFFQLQPTRTWALCAPTSPQRARHAQTSQNKQRTTMLIQYPRPTTPARGLACKIVAMLSAQNVFFMF